MANSSYKDSIKLGISLKPTSEVQNELNSAIQQLEKNSSIDLKIDTKQINQSLKDFSETLNNISNQMKSNFNFQGVFTTQANGVEGVTGKLKEEQKAIEQTIDIAKVLSKTKVAVLNDDGSIKETLKDITKVEEGLGKIQTLTKDGKTGVVTTKIEDSSVSQEKIANQIQDAWDKAYTNRVATEQKAQTKIEADEKKAYDNEILRLGEKAIAEQKAMKEIEATKSKMQSSVNTLSSNSKNSNNLNGFIDESVIKNIQNRLNSINTNSADSEIKELQNAIKNLSSSEPQIVRVQNAILKLENGLTAMKGKYGNLVGDSSSKESLANYIAQIENLKKVLSSLNNGESFNPAKLSQELGKGTNASRELNTAVKNSSSALRLAQKDATTFGESLKHALQNTGIYMGTYQAVQMLTNTFKDAITYVVQLDSAMTNLKKVTQETDQTYSSFLNQAHDIAMEYGSQSDKVVDATTSWAKTGESLTNATELAKSTMLLTKVGDVENVATAQQYMIAPLKAFNIEASKSITLIDKYNNISNNMATGTNDLGEALSKSASSMSTAGNTLEQTLALIATAESQTKLGGDVIGQAMKTTSLRIASFKDENGELIPKFEEQLKTLGVTMRDTTTGQILPTFEILKQVGEKFKTMGTNDKLNVSQLLGGKLQANVVSSILNNVDELNRAYGLAQNSSNSAMNEFKTYQQGVQYSIDRLKESMNNLYTNIMSSQGLKSFIDGLTGVVSVFGNLSTVVAIATTALLIFKGQAIMGVIQSIGVLIAGETAMTVATTGASLAWEKLSLAMSENPLGAIALIFTGTILLINKLKNAQAELIESNKQVIDSYATEKQSISQANKLFEEKQKLESQISNTNEGTKENKDLKEKLLDIERQLAQALPDSTSGYDAQGKAISSNNKLIQAQIDLKNKQLQQDSLKQLKDNTTMFDDDIKSFKNMQQTLENYKKSREEVIAKNASAKASGNKLVEFSTQQAIDDYNKEISAMETSVAQRRLLILQLVQTGKSYKEIADDIGESEDVVKSYTDVVNDNTDKQKSNSNQTQQSANSITSMKNAMKELNSESGKISDSTLKSLQEAFPDLSIDASDTSGAVKKFNKELADSSNIISDAQKELKGLDKDGKLSESTISKLASAFPELKINSSNAKDMLSKFPDVLGDMEKKAKDAQDAMNKLADEFSKFGDEAKMIDTIKDEMSKYNGITEDTMGTLISKYPDLLKVMSQEGDLTENLTKKQIELRAEQENKKQEAIAKANEVTTAEVKADADTTKSNADANATKTANDTNYTETAKANADDVSNTQQKNDTDSANNNADTTSTKSQNDADYNNTVRTNAGETTSEQGQNYEEDKTNNSNANEEKKANTITFRDLVVSLAWGITSGNWSAYEADKNNFIDSIKEKIKWLMFWKDSSVETPTKTPESSSDMNPNGTPKGLKVDDETIKKVQDARAVEEKAKADAIKAKVYANMPKTITTKQASDTKSDSKSENKEAEKAEKLADDIAKEKSDITIDRYAGYNSILKQIEDNITANKTLQDSLTEGSLEYQQTQLQEITLLKQKQDAIKSLNVEHAKERDEIKANLSQYSFQFDAQGKLINGQARLLEIQKSVNEMGGNTQADLDKKKEYIQWVKDLQEETKKYSELVDTTIPSVANQWNELGNSIQKTAETMATALRDEIVEELKKQITKSQETQAKNLEKRKQNDIDDLDKQIDKLKKQLADLDDDTIDKQTKLAKLQAERQAWSNVTNSVNKDSKMQDLDTQIAELQKDIKKDGINSEIEELEAKKDSKSKYYEEIEKANKESNDKQLDDNKLYAKANELLQNKSADKILEILKNKEPDFKNIWTKIGQTSADAYNEQMQKIKDGLNAMDIAKGGGKSSSNSSTGNSSSNSKSSSYTAKNGDHVWIENASKDEIYADPSHNNSKGSGWSNGVASSNELIATGYENGFMRVSDKNGKDLGWVENNKLKRFATGGRTGDLGKDGKLGIIDSYETILNADDTKQMDKNTEMISGIYDYITSTSGALISQLSSQYTNPSNYSLPSLVGTNLNGIANGITNNSSDNSNKSVEVNNEFNIVNQHQVQSDSLPNNITKLMKAELSKFNKFN